MSTTLELSNAVPGLGGPFTPEQQERIREGVPAEELAGHLPEEDAGARARGSP